ncbi:Uncharacterized protein HZ326_30062 [Fusarium oxysporum f. sp. albedinis]|nr:Uncharacterized protein HZ326_30062 [Fusarium oxysporum f. sp. albedinis]
MSTPAPFPIGPSNPLETQTNAGSDIMRNFGRTPTTTPDASSSASTFSIYNQQVVASEWTEQWFFMNGRVHSYALTWEVEQRDGLESDTGAITQYTIPVLIVKVSREMSCVGRRSLLYTKQWCSSGSGRLLGWDGISFDTYHP